MVDGYIVQGDLYPALVAHLVDGAGSPIDLTGATVTCRTLAANKSISETPSTILGSPNAGVVQHDWVLAETLAPGNLSAVFIVNRSGALQTFPGAGPIQIVVRPRLGF